MSDQASRADIDNRAMIWAAAVFLCAAGLLAHAQWRGFLEYVTERQSRRAVEAAAVAGLQLADVRGRLSSLSASPDLAGEAGAIRVATPPRGEVWAQLADSGRTVLVYARDGRGDWWALRLDAAKLTDGRIASAAAVRRPRPSVRLSGVGVEACAAIAGADIAVCMAGVTPVFSAAGLGSALFFVVLIVALALILIESRRRLAAARSAGALAMEQAESVAVNRRAAAAAVAAPACSVEAHEQFFGASIGFWRADFARGMIEFGPVAAAMLGTGSNGVMPIAQFGDAPGVGPEIAGLPARIADKSRAGGVKLTTRSADGREWILYWGQSSMPCGVVIYGGHFAESGLRAILEAYPGPLASWDEHGRLQYCNGNFQRIFRLSDQLLRPGASRDAIWAEAGRAVRYEQAGDNGARELMLLTDEWLSYVERRKTTGGSIGAGMDVTHIKRQEIGLQASEGKMREMVGDLDRMRNQAEEMARRYEEARNAAERASQSKSVFLANMSHELRTPLNAINGFSEMLCKEIYGPLGDRRYKGYAEDILNSGQHLLDMINDILDIAKIEAGKMSLSLRRIDPVEPVDAAMRMMRRHAADKKISLKLTQSGKLPEIEADHRAIKQMALNLVSNAIKFTDEGGRIDIVIRVEGEFVVVSVKDDGCGIPEEDLPRLAQPFEQSGANESRNVQGTGLGLALTKSFAEMHGGKMTIHSRVGEGSVVTFYLPITGALPDQKSASG